MSRMSIHTVVTLRLAARLKGRRFIVLVNGDQPVALSYTCFDALLVLMENRLLRSNGYTPSHELGEKRSTLHKTISRMRRDFDIALASTAGQSLIQHAGRSVYTLNLPVEGLSVDNEALDLPLDRLTLKRITRVASLCKSIHSEAFVEHENATRAADD